MIMVATITEEIDPIRQFPSYLLGSPESREGTPEPFSMWISSWPINFTVIEQPTPPYVLINIAWFVWFSPVIVGICYGFTLSNYEVFGRKPWWRIWLDKRSHDFFFYVLNFSIGFVWICFYALVDVHFFIHTKLLLHKTILWFNWWCFLTNDDRTVVSCGKTWE